MSAANASVASGSTSIFSRTCPVEPHLPDDPVPLFSNGNLNFKAHDVGWILCTLFTIVATVTSGWLVFKHLTYYTCPLQQRHIVRLVLMVPIYAVVSTLSFYFYKEALYYQVIRDCYEAVVVTSFFYLLLQFLGDTTTEQHAVLQPVKMKKWMWPLGFVRSRPSDGLGFLWIMKLCILQYAIVRPVCTFATVIMQYTGTYCLASWMPWFGHVWMALIISISVSIALYALLQFYWELRTELAPYKPLLKFLAVKTTVFLTFWQDTFLSLLVGFDVIKPSQYWNADQIQVGINALLCTFEMVIFGFLHVKAFTYRDYRPEDHKRTTSRGRALLHVLDFRDWFWEMKSTTVHYAGKFSGRNHSYVEDVRAEKYRHLEKALGRTRNTEVQRQLEQEKTSAPTFWKRGLDHPEEDEKQSRPSTDVERAAKSVAPQRTASRWRFWATASPSRVSLAPASTDQPQTLLSKLRDLEKAAEEGPHEGDGLLSYAARLQGEQGGVTERQHPELTLLHRAPDFDGALGSEDVPDPQFEDEVRVQTLWERVYDSTGRHYMRPSEQEEQDHGHGRQSSWWQAVRERVAGWADAQGQEDAPPAERDPGPRSYFDPADLAESPLSLIIDGKFDARATSSSQGLPVVSRGTTSSRSEARMVQTATPAAAELTVPSVAYDAAPSDAPSRMPVATAKQPASAVGPKGKVISLVMPDALSPSRYPRNSPPPWPAPPQMPPAQDATSASASQDGPYAAAARALSTKRDPQPSPRKPRLEGTGPKHPHLSPVQAVGGSSFAVGSIVSPTAQALAIAPGYSPPRASRAPSSRVPGRSAPTTSDARSRHRDPRRAPPTQYDRWTGDPIRVPASPQQQRQQRSGAPATATSSGFGIIEYVDDD